MIFSPYDNASSGDESIGFLVFAISLFPIILPSATIQPFNVGYTTVNNGGSAYITGGMCFVTPGGENFKLSDIKLSGSTWGTDKIQFIDPATSAIDLTKVYDYYGPNDGATADDEGWYYTGTNPDGDYVGDEILKSGDAFLCSFYSPAVKVVFPSID